MPRRSSRWIILSRLSRNTALIARVSLRTTSSASSGIAVDVLDVAGGALDRELSRPPGPDVMRVELVDEERALQLARGAHPPRQLFPLDQLAGRIAGIAQEERGESAPLDLLAKIVGREGVSALSFE